MPYELTWEPRGVCRRYFGDVTVEERLHSFDRICGDPRFDQLRYALTDFLAVAHFEVSDTSTEEIAALHLGPQQTNPNVVIAAVAVDAQVVSAIEHFIALGFVRQPYRVFATEAAARAWIAGCLQAPGVPRQVRQQGEF